MQQLNYQRSFQYYLGCIAFVICVFPKLITIGIIGLAVFVIAGYIKKEIRFQWNSSVFFLALLYLAYLLGVLYTQNEVLAHRYVENKLAFLVFPVLLSFRFKKAMDFSAVATGLVTGVTVTAMLGLLNAYKCYTTVPGASMMTCFTSGNFSHLHHPSYFAVFLIVAVTAAWYGYFNHWKAYRLVWIIPFSAFALLMYGLCLSLAGLLFLFVLGFVAIMIWTFRRAGKKIFIIAVTVLVALGLALLVAVPQVRMQFTDSENVLVEYLHSPDKFILARTDYKEGNEVRLIMWTVTAKEISIHPLGVGTGNVDAHLSRRLATYGQMNLAVQDDEGGIQFNPHNQFLQTGLEIGLEGLAILLLMIITAIAFAWKYKNWVLMVLVGSLIFNSLFESMLQRQSGIVFYSFWLCILVVYSNSKSRKSESQT